MGLHDTLVKDFTHYESMIKSADRAENAAAQMDENNLAPASRFLWTMNCENSEQEDHDVQRKKYGIRGCAGSPSGDRQRPRIQRNEGSGVGRTPDEDESVTAFTMDLLDEFSDVGHRVC